MYCVCKLCIRYRPEQGNRQFAISKCKASFCPVWHWLSASNCENNFQLINFFVGPFSKCMKVFKTKWNSRFSTQKTHRHTHWPLVNCISSLGLSHIVLMLSAVVNWNELWSLCYGLSGCDTSGLYPLIWNFQWFLRYFCLICDINGTFHLNHAWIKEELIKRSKMCIQ